MAAAKDKTLIEVTVVGQDRKGVVADITNFIFINGGNIEKISQNVIRGLFGMQLEASFMNIDRMSLDAGLKKLSQKLSMEIRVHYQEPNRLQNVAIFVSKEPHCIEKILEAKKRGAIKTNISVIIGSDVTLKSIAEDAGIPFHTIAHGDQGEAENKILQ
jgi:formyltetrahydrofolate deformylase